MHQIESYFIARMQLKVRHVATLNPRYLNQNVSFELILNTHAGYRYIRESK
jgi:hypothetical protein